MAFFFDTAIPRKSSLVDGTLSVDTDAAPIPSVVEVNVSGTCNRTCVFCPRSDPGYPDVKEFVSPDLLEKLSKQLGEVGFKGIFLFSGFGEPMLAKNIFDLIALVHRNLPDSRVEMVTNGDTLNEKQLRRLFNSGLSTLLISVYDGKEDADKFEAMCRSENLTDDQFVIRHRYRPPEEDYGITLNNRGGTMGNAEHPRASLTKALATPCYYPHYTFFMDYQGDVAPCCHDWGKKLILGNMEKQSFQEIWLSDKWQQIRLSLADSNRQFSPCNVCDVKGTLIGDKHVEAWAAFYKDDSD